MEVVRNETFNATEQLLLYCLFCSLDSECIGDFEFRSYILVSGIQIFHTHFSVMEGRLIITFSVN